MTVSFLLTVACTSFSRQGRPSSQDLRTSFVSHQVHSVLSPAQPVPETKQGEEGSSYIHTVITLLLVYTNRVEEGRSHSQESRDHFGAT